MKVKKTKRIIIYTMCFLVPLAIATCYFIYRRFAPFGNSSILTVDMGQQYIDFFAHYRDTLLHNPNGFIYSFANALGGGMIGTWSYYLMSPLNLLILLFPLAKMPSAIAIISLLKYGLSGLSFGYFLIQSKKYISWSIVGFATAYALMGWMIANQFNTLWIDAAIILPIIFLGFQKLLRDQSSVLYVVALTAMFIINYYMGWMIAMFLTAYMVIYGIARAYPVEISAYGHIIFKWIKASVLSAMLSAWLLIPTFFSLLAGKTHYTRNQFQIRFEYNPLDMLGKFFNGSVDFKQLPSGTANIFVGSIVVVLFIYYFFIPTIKKNIRFANLGLTAFMIFSMVFQPLDLLWHGWQLPVWYTFRFSYLFSFLMIITAFSAFLHILSEGLDYKRFLITLGLIILGVAYVGLFKKHFEYLKADNFIWGSVFLVISIGVIIACAIYKKSLLLSVAVFAVMAGEMGLNMVTSLNNLDYLKSSDYTTYAQMLRKEVNQVKKRDKGFYRIGTTFARTKNDAFTADYNGGSIFSSTLEADTSQFFKHIGQPNGDSFVLYSNGTMFTDSLLGMKYYMNQQIPENNPNKKRQKEPVPALTRKPDLNSYELLSQDKLIGTYQNPYALPLGFLTPKSGMNNDKIASDPIEYQNELAHRLDPNIKRLYEPTTYSHIQYNNIYKISKLNNAILKKNMMELSYIILTIPVQKDTSYYMTLGTNFNKGQISISVDGQNQTQFTPSERTIIANIGNEQIDGNINVQIFVNASSTLLHDFRLYKVHNSKIAKFSNDMKKNPYKITQWNERSMTGTVNVKSNQQALTTTIPYSKGWHAKVDGKAVTPKKWENMFLYVPMTKGHHTVKLSFWPEGLTTGIILGLIGWALIGFEFYRTRRKKQALPTQAADSTDKPSSK
ncbi:membrane protein [Lentilactobacillus fungorum]|uniref:Membrane protein n=1 Tax=Lentilactobacillus fungorum TaxID=2201250 RepID=A0ABQ3VWU1_9LACO|nr:YfhO family protein [Lentilactobacillus fungorum]GHP12891.1 membrane protein [Lentilactobacillus fungorum]